MSASFIFVIRVLLPTPSPGALLLPRFPFFFFFSFYFLKNSDLILLTCQLQVKKSEIYINIFSGSRKQDSVKCKGKEEEKES